MGRVREAVMLPLIVFPAAAVIAVAIGWLLHQVPRFYAPGLALLLTVLVTAAGFFFSSRADRR
jgi:hypothetical protein